MNRPLRIGAVIPCDLPPADIMATAKRLDNHVDSLWVVDDLAYNGGISQAALVLAATQHVSVGLGVTPVGFRHPVSLAMEFATLHQAFAGRFVAGLGHGVQSWMAQIGERVASPMTRLRETHDLVRRLTKGEAVDADGRYVTARSVGLANFDTGLPIYIGARGPVTIQYASDHADGMIVSDWTSPSVVRKTKELLRPEQPLVVYVAFDVLKAGALDAHIVDELDRIRCRPDVVATLNPDVAPVDIDADDIRRCSALDGDVSMLNDYFLAGATEVVLLPSSRHAVEALPDSLERLTHEL